jgi:hypothetical protein
MPPTSAHPLARTSPLATAGAPVHRTGAVGRAVRLLLALGLAYGLGTLVDQGGPASVRAPETLTDAPFVVLTTAMVAVYAILVSQLAKLVAGEAVARMAWRVALVVLAAAAAIAAVVGEVGSGPVWGSPLSDLVWALDVAMLVQTVVALLLAVALGTRGCEIGVWAEIAARLRGRPASPPLCIVGLHHLDDWELRRRSAPGFSGRRHAIESESPDRLRAGSRGLDTRATRNGKTR